MIFIKEQIFNEVTGQYEYIDERNFEFCVIHQLKVIRETAKEKILAVAPEYKQRNAALGLLSTEETDELKNSINSIRAISNSLEQQILNVSWDGNESTRSTACDAVQNVRWP
jgi:hypothetical protein